MIATQGAASLSLRSPTWQALWLKQKPGALPGTAPLDFPPSMSIIGLGRSFRDSVVCPNL